MAATRFGISALTCLLLIVAVANAAADPLAAVVVALLVAMVGVGALWNTRACD